MRALIAEDDFTCRAVLQKLLERHGSVNIAVNGRETIEAVRMAVEAGEPYDLICLDIKMPEMDGQEVLTAIRRAEAAAGVDVRDQVKIVMATALEDESTVLRAIYEQCDAYLVKPITGAKLRETLVKLGLAT